MGRKLQSATARTATTSTSARRDMPAPDSRIPRSGRAGARLQRAVDRSTPLQKVAEWFGGVRGRRKTMLLRQRGHRLRHHRHHSRHDAPPSVASTILDDIREAIAADGARQRQHLRHRSARPDDPRRRDDRDRDRCRRSGRPRRSASAQRLAAERAAAVAGQPARAGRGDRRLRRRQPQRLRDRVRSHRPRQQLVLRARRTTRRPTSATASSTGSR